MSIRFGGLCAVVVSTGAIFASSAAGQDSGAGASPPVAPPAKVDADITFAAYLWTPSMGGRSGIAGNDVSIDASFLDLLSNTDTLIGFMAHAEVDVNHFQLLLDPVWTHLEKNDAVPQAAVKTDATLDSIWFGVHAGYRFIDHAPLGGDNSATKISVDALGGALITSLSFTLQPDGQPNIPLDRTWADPMIGTRVTLDFGDHLGMVLRGEIGGFDVESKVCADMFAGLGYKFPMGDSANGVVFLGFRALYQDYNRDDFEWRAWVYGPTLGFQITF
jgi:hypothetical protein